MRALVLMVFVNALGLASTYPTVPHNNDSCLVLTPKKIDQINEIAQKIGEYIAQLTNQYDDIDISSVSLNFEKHFEGEAPKETVISINVNDCSEKDSEPKDNYVDASKIIQDFEDGNLDKGVDVVGGIYGEVSIAVVEPPPKATDYEDYVYVPSCSCVQTRPPVKPEVMILQVNDEQEQLLQALEKSRPGPLVLFQQRAPGGDELIVF
ncbi:uncharacterized protein [Epargyreus clarus]|uniref:uncharacterized protein n=1 Tax=Epargyreus clarus TaxID=520877 RepID=UPI003C2D6B32